jgi:hypothetical protein
MKRSDIEHLYYITHIDNLASILKNGILSHNRIKNKKIDHEQIYDPAIQEIRKNKRLPNGKRLHDYANLYFNARNAMMYKRKDIHREICILIVDPKILNATYVVISDMNASSGYARFYTADELNMLDEDLIFAQDWRHRNPIEYLRRRSAVCAEVLVPNFVPSAFIIGTDVSCNETAIKVKDLLSESPLKSKVLVNNDLFFQW